ncbi:uncharacterized protein LOC115883419 isoform X2 [Sitophilus oryzae]|uniref:Uncharacterized protein LOC115883419 isoform X2 n=1 Tax=Sitophilus oryzae TaxID=7048 RepID=A0A6J2Y3Y0_SITOR|nr:uncharacterized protein LOC115883419 isoform X2 [Sitophilus oryzae]
MINNLPLNHIKFLVYFFNQVLYHSELIPDDWKTGLVCPIPKPNKNLNNISGYRPITLTSCIGKTMEDIVKCRLDWYVENHKILSDSQFGFRKGSSFANIFFNSTVGVWDFPGSPYSDPRLCVIIYINV